MQDIRFSPATARVGNDASPDQPSPQSNNTSPESSFALRERESQSPTDLPGIPSRIAPADFAAEEPSRSVPPEPSWQNKNGRRDETTKDHDRARIAELYVNDHLTQAQIAAELGISQSQVSRELAILKKKWRTICRSILQESLQDALLILDEASQYYRQNYHHSVEHAHSPELRDVGEASPEGKIETRKSTRVRRVKPYSDRSVDGLVKVSKEIVRVTELLQQENAKYPDPDPFAGLTHEERADVLGQMLAAAFERALKKVPVATSESPGGDGKGADSTFDPDPAEDNGIAEPSMAERLAAPICDLLC